MIKCGEMIQRESGGERDHDGKLPLVKRDLSFSTDDLTNPFPPFFFRRCPPVLVDIKMFFFFIITYKASLTKNNTLE